jgi:hypothetical protein
VNATSPGCNTDFGIPSGIHRAIVPSLRTLPCHLLACRCTSSRTVPARASS